MNSVTQDEQTTQGTTQSPMSGMPETSYMKLEIRGKDLWVMLDSPGEKHNTLSTPLMKELWSVLQFISGESAGTVQKILPFASVVITSAKPGTFIAGADIHEIESITSATEAEEKARLGQDIMNAVEDLPIPAIALIDGPALGGGLELALACDWRLVTDNPKTQLGLPEVSLGIMPGFGGSWRYPRLVGLSRALPLMLAGKPVTGEQAAKSKLADVCVPAGFFEDRGREFVAKHRTKRKKYVTKHKGPLFARLGGWFVDRTLLGKMILLSAARRELMRKTGGHYPAPLELVKSVKASLLVSRKNALIREATGFGRLATTAVSKHLIRIFFGSERAKKGPAPIGKPVKVIDRVSILGAGVMGGKIAWLFSKYEYPVTMKDVSWDAIAKGLHSAQEVWKELATKGRSDPRIAELAMHRISGCTDYSAIRHADFVVEAIVENLDVKRQVLKETEASIGTESIMVSNTSSLSVTAMGQALKHPERFAGMHFFNPVNRMPLVEVIAGAATSTDTLATVYRLCQKLGKVPVLVKDGPGFLVNRLLLPYLVEAVIMLEEGWRIAELDRIVKDWGMPMGPCTLLDEVGLDVAYKVGDVLADGLGDRMIRPAQLKEIVVGKKMLGKKNGIGFYTYSKGKKPTVNTELESSLTQTASKKNQTSRSGTIHARKDTVIDRCFLLMVNEAARCLEEGVVGDAETCDLALIMGTGFPPFLGGLLAWADSRGLPEVRNRLEELATNHGNRFAPAPLIERLSKNQQSFYKAFPYKGI